MTTRVHLNDAEMLLLDARCRPLIQEQVNFAKQRTSLASQYPDTTEDDRVFILNAIQEATASGRLIYQKTYISFCPICNKTAGYALAKRTTSKVSKGEPDHSKPLSMEGVELADRFIRITRHVAVGGCFGCITRLKPILVSCLSSILAELPEELMGFPPKYIKYRNGICKKCGWAGHEGLMGRLQTLMGDGTYPGECPSCHCKNLPFGPNTFEMPNTFVVVPRS